MVYDEKLAQRVAVVVGERRADEPLHELKMFGGWGLMIQGNMSVGVIGDALMVRVGPDAYEHALAQAGAREFDFTGRPMRGWVSVDQSALGTKAKLGTWVDRGIAYAVSLPPGGKSKKPAKPRPRVRG